MNDIQHTDLSTQSRRQGHQQKSAQASHPNTMKATGPHKYRSSSRAVRSCIRRIAPRRVTSAAARNALIHPKYQEVESSDDSDGEYGVKPKKKKLKIAHIDEKIPVGNTGGGEDQVLGKICNGLGIQFSLFDSWVEDPWLKDPSKMNIPFMPNEVMMEIFGYCRTEVLVQCEKSCRRFQSLLKDNTR